MSSRLHNLAGACGLLVVAGGLWLLAAAPVGGEDVLTVTPEREAAALAFAKRHHPELARLLERLKDSDPAGHHEAVRDLLGASERLARVRARTPDRYESELAIWKLDSRIRLLAARAALMKDRADLRAGLKELLLRRSDLRLELLRNDREKVAARLERLDASIDRLFLDREEAAERELNRLLNTARSRAVRLPVRADTAQGDADP